MKMGRIVRVEKIVVASSEKHLRHTVTNSAVTTAINKYVYKVYRLVGFFGPGGLVELIQVL